MAEPDETLPIAADAQADVVETTAAAVAPAKPSRARATKIKSGSLDRTALSSATPMLPPELAAPSAVAEPSPAAEPTPVPAKQDARPHKLAVAAAKPAPAKPVAGRPAKAKPVAVKPLSAQSAQAISPKPVSAKAVASKPAAPKPTLAKAVPARPVSAKPIISKPAKVPLPYSKPADPAPALRATRIVKTVSNTPAASPLFSFKDKIMDMSANFSTFQDAISQAQAKAQAAFEKSSSYLGEAGEFAKGNVEAVIESGKIFADGVQEIGSTFVAEGRTAFEGLTGDIKELAAAKSPTDFLKVQSDMVRKNFDSAVAYSSKNSETFLKLMSDAFAPISGRVSLAVEKARQTTPFSAPVSTGL